MWLWVRVFPSPDLGVTYLIVWGNRAIRRALRAGGYHPREGSPG